SGASVAEVADAGKNHCQTEAVGRVDDFRMANRAARLDNGRGTSVGDFLNAIGKREESVGCGDGSLERQYSFHGTYAAGVHTTHLAGTYSHRLAVSSVNNGVRFYVFTNFPGEQERPLFRRVGRPLGNNLQIRVSELVKI